ncbi:MAG: hypothetical protein RRY36_03565 [Bacteroidaceae bacterium]
MREIDPREEFKVNVIFWIITSICVLVMCMLMSCKTQYVPVEKIKTEYVDHFKHDSINVHDSVIVRLKGDTVWLEKWHTKYQSKLVHDSINVIDSIPIPYEVEKKVYVDKELNWWQQTIMILGYILMMLGLLKGAFWLLKKKLK